MEYSLFIGEDRFLQEFLNDKTWRKWYWPDFFPLDYNGKLTYDILLAEGIAPVAANVIAYGTPAPEKRRRTIEKIRGDIPKTSMKRIMDEVAINDYNDLQHKQNVPESKIMDFIFDDVTACFEGCQARREVMCLEALSSFTLSYTVANNDTGIRTKTDIDYQLPAANKRKIKGATARKWDNGTTSNYKPITDFKDITEAVEDVGKVRPKFAVMNLTNWRQFRMAADVIDISQQFEVSQTPFASLPAINLGLAKFDLPQVILVDPQVNHESSVHNLTSTNPWTTNYVTFLPYLSVGKLLWGDIAAQTNPAKQSTQAFRDGILIEKFSDLDPIREITKGESNCIPAIPNVSDCWRLAVTTTSGTGV